MSIEKAIASCLNDDKDKVKDALTSFFVDVKEKIGILGIYFNIRIKNGKIKKFLWKMLLIFQWKCKKSIWRFF